MNEHREAHEPPLAAQRHTVMLVDDDPGVRAALKLWLEVDNDVISCADGAEALSMLRGGAHPNLIVLDLVMPSMNGWEFRVAQRKVPEWAAIPVVVLSADETAQGAAIDADAHLHKPVEGEVLLATCADVLSGAARRRMELLRAGELQRLVSLGALLGGIAHEVNNPLAFVYGSIDLLQRKLVDMLRPNQVLEPLSIATAMRALERAREGADRITAVIRSASLLASSDFEGFELLDVHSVLESAIQVASNEIRYGANLVRNYHDAPFIRGNAARLGQVFVNLLLNALYAIRDAGGREHVIRVETERAGDTVRISVVDSASTVTAAKLESGFDPVNAVFGTGTHLRFGLSVSREFIEDMGGTLEAAPEQPRGSRYVVVLPCASDEVVAAPPARTPLRLGAHRPSVLVVDDEPILCEILSTTLADDFEVTAFSSSRAALEALLERDFDVVLCDVMMPDLTGTELFDRVARERPELAARFVFITGGAFTDRARLLLKQTGRPLLKKPCERRELLQTLRQVAERAI